MESGLCFSVDPREANGDVLLHGVFVHLPNGVSLRFENSSEVARFADAVKALVPAIRDEEQA